MKKILIIFGLLWLILLLPISKSTNNQIILIPKMNIVDNNQSKNLGTLIIKKIKLKEDFYQINAKENNVEEHVTILKESILPPNENSIIFLAAHSGTGKIAYFQELDKLTEKDKIILIINNKKYNYQVKDIWEERKNGFINVNKEIENQLILTTCSPTKEEYQLIINCIQKES